MGWRALTLAISRLRTRGNIAEHRGSPPDPPSISLNPEGSPRARLPLSPSTPEPCSVPRQGTSIFAGGDPLHPPLPREQLRAALSSGKHKLTALVFPPSLPSPLLPRKHTLGRLGVGCHRGRPLPSTQSFFRLGSGGSGDFKLWFRLEEGKRKEKGKFQRDVSAWDQVLRASKPRAWVLCR
jgi:hypothetical protein